LYLAGKNQKGIRTGGTANVRCTVARPGVKAALGKEKYIVNYTAKEIFAYKII
jgi:hypothetical protein